MPMHDWTRVPDGIFHAFHHRWISAISDVLNGGLLPKNLYALPEQVTSRLGPDVLTLQRPDIVESGDHSIGAGTAVRSRPKTRYVQESEKEFYRRRRKSVVIRHVSDDHIISIVEIVSRGNKSSRNAMQAFVDKACALLERRIHLLLIDPFLPGKRDPNGIHALIWGEVEDASFKLPAGKHLTLVAYECDITTIAYVELMEVGDKIPKMPLFLESDRCVMLPLEATYQTTFGVMPERWRSVLQPSK